MSSGIAYQLVSTDPLLDTDQCKRDAKQMQDLGANAIRVYHVDPAGDHRGCMAAFADAGIYLFVDLDDFPTQIQPVSFQLLAALTLRLISLPTGIPRLESIPAGRFLYRHGRIPEV